MKNNITFILSLLLFAVISTQASAQDFLADARNEVHLFNQTSLETEQVPEWWYKVEKEANLPPEATPLDVEAADLQEIIYYATLYGERFDFRASVVQLLDVYQYHNDERYRMLAVSALHAIGDPFGIEGLRKALRYESSPRIRNVTKAALKSFDSSSQ